MPTKVLIVVLSTYERDGWYCKELAEFIYSLRFGNDSYATAVGFAHNFAPAAAARNFTAKQFKGSEAEWLLMIDNDMAPPDNLLDTLKDVPADAGIVVPMFHLFDGNVGQIVLCWGKGEDAVGSFGAGFHEITKCGTGCIFIHRSVFEKLQPPWFQYLYDEHHGVIGTEDIYFCAKAQEAGVKIYGNGSVAVGHFRTINILTLKQHFERIKNDLTVALQPDTVALDNSKVESQPAEASPAEAKQ